MKTQFCLTDDVIDVRDLIERVEFLSPEFSDTQLTGEEREELAKLTAILEDLAGNGGDEKWRGDWYPTLLIADHYFEQHARELAEDCGLTDRPMGWPYNCIDWEYAAKELKYDYSSTDIDGSSTDIDGSSTDIDGSSTDIDGVTYWFR